MKSQSTGNLRLAAITAAVGAGLTSTAIAGDEIVPAPIAPAEEGNDVSGSLSFDYNTHFVSYGFDVWGSGENFGGSATFNPSLELNFALTDTTSLFLGTWWDVNDNIPSSIGGDLQEIDIWAGIGTSFGPVSVSATYQAWMYGSDTEHILDIGLGYDCLLSPSLTIHNRLDEGASGGDTGTILVLGVSHDFALGPVTITPSADVAFFLTDGFHGTDAVTGLDLDTGYGYAALGLNASMPLAFMGDRFGEWDIHGGVTYYMTEADVVQNAKDNDFLTGTIGIGCSF